MTISATRRYYNFYMTAIFPFYLLQSYYPIVVFDISAALRRFRVLVVGTVQYFGQIWLDRCTPMVGITTKYSHPSNY